MAVGALLMLGAVVLQSSYDQRRDAKRRELEHKVKEIETINLLNKKINEILQKRTLFLEEYVSFDSFDDCYITIDEFVYLQSFAAQNNFYLPTYILEEFFKKIAHRKVVLSPEEVTEIGGYTYKGGRVILENFSDDLVEMIEEKKIQLKRMSNRPLPYVKQSF
ncbi:hypothetical protein RU97_GL000347 [Enterococcus canis]|uniref:Uncharacterized protein n=1 Tax=Enterococcus canis TaxID=214095 RepID=A0A1L8RK71_9ENTE|nr:hypothetical protein RU97_GL000347 [Enterococcus canis]